jgi:hypothetical protein
MDMLHSHHVERKPDIYIYEPDGLLQAQEKVWLCQTTCLTETNITFDLTIVLCWKFFRRFCEPTEVKKTFKLDRKLFFSQFWFFSS